MATSEPLNSNNEQDVDLLYQLFIVMFVYLRILRADTEETDVILKKDGVLFKPDSRRFLPCTKIEKTKEGRSL